MLVSFSTTFQGQAGQVRRCIAALSNLPVRALVTLGPALEGRSVEAAANVEVVQSASHDEIVPRCALMICHGGHGTVIRPLMHGVPVICMPMGRDQPENAARIAARGAGLTLRAGAGKRIIRRAVSRVLADPSYNASRPPSWSGDRTRGRRWPGGRGRDPVSGRSSDTPRHATPMIEGQIDQGSKVFGRQAAPARRGEPSPDYRREFQESCWDVIL